MIASAPPPDANAYFWVPWLLVTLLVGITVVNIGASALAAAIAEQVFGSKGLGIAIAGMVFLLTVFGEVLPMTLAVEHPLRFSAWVNRPVAWLSILLKPIRAGLGAFIGQHGSWNRSTLSGYKVVFVPFDNGRPSGPPRDILSGFLAPDERESYGRPVGVTGVSDPGGLEEDDVVVTIDWGDGSPRAYAL